MFCIFKLCLYLQQTSKFVVCSVDCRMQCTCNHTQLGPNSDEIVWFSATHSHRKTTWKIPAIFIFFFYSQTPPKFNSQKFQIHLSLKPKSLRFLVRFLLNNQLGQYLVCFSEQVCMLFIALHCIISALIYFLNFSKIKFTVGHIWLWLLVSFAYCTQTNIYYF